MNKESRSDVLLVFPPCSDAQVLQPYLSLPILARHLKDHGFSVRQADLDLEFFEWVMVPETLRKHREHWERQLKGASNKDSSTIGQLAQMYMQSLFMEENESWLRRKRSHACRMNRLLMDFIKGELGFEHCFSAGSNREFQLPHCSDYVASFFDTMLDRYQIPGGYHVVALSIAMGPQLVPGILFAKRLAQLDSRVHIAVGGAAIDLASDEILAQVRALPWLGSVTRGGGPETLRRIAEKARNGTKIENSSEIECIDLGAQRPPDFEESLLAAYPNNVYLPVQYAYGCYWNKCAYCSFNQQVQKRVRLKPAKALVNEIAYLAEKYDCRRFSFTGDALPPAYGERVCDHILEKKLGLRFWSYVRVDSRFTAERVAKLRDAGCHRVTIGAESLNNRLLERMRKGYNEDLVYEIVDRFNRAGIEIKLNIIWDFPSTTASEALDVLAKLPRTLPKINQLEVFNFSLERKTDVASSPAEFGIELNPAPGGHSGLQSRKSFYDEVPYRDLYGMSLDEKNRIYPGFHELRRKVFQQDLKRENQIDDMWGEGWPKVWSQLARYVLVRRVEFPNGHSCWIAYNYLNEHMFAISDKSASVIQTANQEEFAQPGGFEALIDTLERTGKLFLFESRAVVTETLQTVVASYT